MPDGVFTPGQVGWRRWAAGCSCEEGERVKTRLVTEEAAGEMKHLSRSAAYRLSSLDNVALCALCLCSA